MNLVRKFLTNNDCYKKGLIIEPKGFMLHSTGANNPNVRRYVSDNGEVLGLNKNNNDWNRAGLKVCVHGFIGYDKDGNIITAQTLPWNMRGWHAGDDANNTHIGVEICEDNLSDATYFNKVYQEAVELVAMLAKQYKWEINENTVLCHCEGYKKGIASNHADVMHWFPKHGKSMDTFRADVKALLGTQATKQEVNNKGEFEMAKSYKNGSTREDVFADTGLTLKTGSLNPWEKCDCLGIVEGRYLVKYKVDGTNKYKCGFVKYHGGVK